MMKKCSKTGKGKLILHGVTGMRKDFDYNQKIEFVRHCVVTVLLLK